MHIVTVDRNSIFKNVEKTILKGFEVMKRKISVFMALVLMLSTIFSVNVFAATSYPTVSSSKYIEFKAQQGINVYKDTACKTRGTSSPSKAYNASISSGDVCYIYKITTSYIQVNYPTSSGRRTAYIKRADLFDKTAPEEYISSAKASVAVYKADGNSSIAKGDKVWRVDPKNGYSGYRAVIYEAKSGNRAYKMGYITLDDLEKIKNSNNGGNSSATSTTESMTNALYKLNIQSSKISCGFDGYVSTSGRHEGIDFNYENGKAIYSLTDGVITRVAKGKNGINGLSTIAIYDSTHDKTVVYLHSAPLSSLSTGQKIKKGDKIGTESWRGCSTSAKGHTHVEVRNGKQTYAAKSVNDSRLDNSNPTSFWESWGYTVK